jgi:hypothetical protein
VFKKNERGVRKTVKQKCPECGNTKFYLKDNVDSYYGVNMGMTAVCTECGNEEGIWANNYGEILNGLVNDD